MSNLIKYRPEIDGLRTIAVLSVILYHANFQIFGQNPIKGGFLGVDIFFVISGYLITSILLTGFREKSLTLLNFYERRIRRILPILLFVMTVSMPFSWMLLLPSDFQSYSYQLLSSIFSVSNFYFWSEDSYWAAESILKPFLHTWSLGVEEQFYLFMPLLVMCFSYKNISRPTFVLLAIALVSLVSSHFMSISDSQSSFYLFPFRSWELLIGASIATYREQQFSDEVFVEKVPYLPSIGLLIIFLSFYFFSESTLHPSFYTLLPTLGVALVILFSNEKDFSIKLLRNKVMNFIGLISYGLYLWHFPIFSYLSHANLFEDSLIKIGAIVLIFVLSIVTYFIIEKPFRSFSSIKSKIFWCILVIWVLLLSMTAVIGMKDGFSFRVPELVNIPSDPENIENHKWFATEKNLRGRVVLVGDSHIGSIAPFFKTWAKDEGFDFAISEWSGCQLILNMNRVSKNDFHPLQNCNIKSQKMRLNFIENLKPSIVMMGGRLPLIIEEDKFDNKEGGYEGKMKDFLQNSSNSLTTLSDRQKAIQKNYTLTINKILDAGHTLVLLYPVPEVGVHVPKELLKKINGKFLKARKAIRDDPVTTSYEVYKKRVEKSVRILDGITENRIYRIKPSEIFCDSEIKGRCITHNTEVSFYRDDDHLSKFGAELIVEEFKELILSEGFHYQY